MADPEPERDGQPVTNYMDNYLRWLESTTPEQRLAATRKPVDDGLCDTCWGSGWLEQFITPCPDCKGTGKKLAPQA